MADRVRTSPPPVIEIGSVNGVVITMTRSRLSRLERIKEEFGDGDHIALSTRDEIKWNERPDISGDILTGHFRFLIRNTPDVMHSAFWKIFPEYDGIPLSKFGFQTGSNDAISGTRDDIHAHVVFALKETWDTGAIPRFVDPVEPVPLEKRKPRNKM